MGRVSQLKHLDPLTILHTATIEQNRKLTLSFLKTLRKKHKHLICSTCLNWTEQYENIGGH